MSNRKLVKKLRELQRIHFGLGQPFKGTAFAKLARIVESNGVDGALEALPKTSKASRAILLDYKSYISQKSTFYLLIVFIYTPSIILFIEFFKVFSS